MRQRGWEQGVIGGDPKWMVAGAFAGSIWLIQWAWRKEPEVVYRTKLKPGESVVVSAAPPVSKRAAKRSSR